MHDENESNGNITALAAYQPNTLEERNRLIKQVAMAPQATDDEFKLFLTVAERLGLDPLAKQIYAIHRKSGKNPDGSDHYQMTIQVGIDGFRAIAADTGEFAGEDRPIFETTPGAKHPDVAIVTVYRFVHGVRCAFTSEARWDEYAQYKDVWQNGRKTGERELTGKWVDMPYNQLAKCSEAQSLRKGFPKQLSGVYTDDEMGQADNPPIVQHAGRVIDASTGEVLSEPKQPKQPTRPAPAKANSKTAPAPVVESAVDWGSIRARMRDVGASTMATANQLCMRACKKLWEQVTDQDAPAILKVVERLEGEKAAAQAKVDAAQDAPVVEADPTPPDDEPEPPAA